MKIRELMEKYQKHAEDVVDKRVKNDKKGYVWLYKNLGYEQELKLKEFQNFFDRKSLNSEYETRYNNDDIPSKKPFAWLQKEINLIYSFHKCFALRNRTRLQSYRDDLAQKGARVRAAIYNSIGKFLAYKDLAERKGES